MIFSRILSLLVRPLNKFINLLTFSAFRMGAYSGWALIRGLALVRINTVTRITSKNYLAPRELNYLWPREVNISELLELSMS